MDRTGVKVIRRARNQREMYERWMRSMERATGGDWHRFDGSAVDSTT